MDWHEQKKEIITSVEALSNRLPLTQSQREGAVAGSARFPMAIPLYYLSLIDAADPACPILRQALPTAKECEISSAEESDPLHEEADAPVPELTHRYPDRVLLLVTNRCFMYCRHCNRRRKVGDVARGISQAAIDKGIEYIRKTKEVHEVLLSGGDPLTLDDGHLEEILGKLRAIEHIQVIRIGTRAPVVFPARITTELVDVLKKHHPLWINTHFNHPRELTDQSRAALARLADGGLPLGNQTVLLKGVNDRPEVLRSLFTQLLANRVRPYYLFQCDLAEGTAHFRTTVGKGLELMESLVGHISGLAVPTYAVDPPGGAGKIPLLPNYLLTHGEGRLILRNYEGSISRYTETHGENNHATDYPTDGPAGMLNADTPDAKPAIDALRQRRR